jgi:hypothetical protein
MYLNNAWAQPGADEILIQLDKNYYYPQQTGLSKLRARVSWEQLDVASDSGIFLRNPDFIFSWMDNGGVETRDFKIVGDSDKYSEERKLELESQIKNYGELIIPLTLIQKFSKYSRSCYSSKCSELTQWGKKRERLILNADSDDESVTSYFLVIDKKEMKIDKIIFKQPPAPDKQQSAPDKQQSAPDKQQSAPDKVNGTFRYKKLDGKWAIAESKSRYTIGELDYQEKSTYRYKKFDKIWLVHRIDQVLKQGNKIYQFHRFKITDVRKKF